MAYQDSSLPAGGAASATVKPRTRRVRAYKHDGGDLTIQDWFCGAGGSSQAAEQVPGLRVSFATNHWKQALKTHMFNLPGVAHYIGNIRKAPVWSWPVADIHWGSPECFPADTMILTRRGTVPIQQVVVGDEVFTHRRRWRRVTSVMRKTADTVRVRCATMTNGIVTTAEHPFYTRSGPVLLGGGDGGSGMSAAVWTPSRDLTEGHRLASPVDFGEPLPVPELPASLTGTPLADVMRMAGTMILRKGVAASAVCADLVDWVADAFGPYGAGRRFPAWALTMPRDARQAFLDGLTGDDGDRERFAVRMHSKPFMIGLRLLVCSLGFAGGLSDQSQPRGKGGWVLAWKRDGGRRLDLYGHRWHRTSRVEPGARAEVFNFSVADDESYVADGFTVHNCTNWSIAKGMKRSFQKAVQGDLLELYAAEEAEKFRTAGDEGPDGPTQEEEESRALMEEVPLYLRGVQERGQLVKAGVVENVVDVRKWAEWDRWIGEFHKLGYHTRLIALNSMHADPRSVHRAPQSRDRLYLAYWHKSLGRHPDWDKWLRPRALCVRCDEVVAAVQVFRKPGRDMGRYKQAYDYRCPKSDCRSLVEPETLPASVAIDWSIKGTPIGSRPKSKDAPEGLAPATMDRIRAGIARYWPQFEAAHEADVQGSLFGEDAAGAAGPGASPLLVPTGGTWRNGAASVDVPMATRTTREGDGLLVPPPMLIPCEGRDGKVAMRLDQPLRTQTARAETAIAYPPPFVIPMRGGGDKEKARPMEAPLHTVTAGGLHHGLVTPAMIMRNNGSRGSGVEHCTPIGEPMRTMTTTGHQSLVTGDPLLMPYYGNGQVRSVNDPIGTLPTRDRYALLENGEWDVSKILFRMLEPKEIGRAMAFADSYRVLGSKRDQIKQYGNAVTPPCAEILLCALVECVTGEPIDRYALAA